jgi:hypothetical protein
MRTATIISVTPDRQLEIPPEIQAQLTPGDEYLIWQTEDTILFKKVLKPLQLDDLFQRIDALTPDPEQPSEAEICQMVKEVRHKQSAHESNS